MNEKKFLERLRREGFTEVRVCPIEPGTAPGEHTHDQHTVHVILSGELTITDHEGSKTFRPGDRVEFPAGTTHKAQGGTIVGSMIVGVKEEPVEESVAGVDKGAKRFQREKRDRY